MKKLILILTISIIFLSSCKLTSEEENKKTSQTEKSMLDMSLNSNLKTIELEFGFKATFSREGDEYGLNTYSHLELTRNEYVLYVDNSEYEIENELSCIVLKTGENSYELLFEIDFRPSKNYLKRIFIQDNKVLKHDKLPTFITKAKDLNNDGVKEYVGFWDYSQVWGEIDSLTAYNPLLYFSVTETGLKLDSALTRERNEIIYGQFYGFSFSEEHEQPVSVSEMFGQEMRRIIKQ
jgi:hypothetical protein